MHGIHTRRSVLVILLLLLSLLVPGGRTLLAQTATTVQEVNNPTYGPILVDSRGFTLYTLSTEANGNITCTGACLTAWPPLILTPPSTAPTGPAGLVGVLGLVTRPDGSKQVTYNGFPLYTFVNDTAAGQTTGEGVNAFGGIWHVAKVAPAGSTSGATATAGAPTATTAAATATSTVATTPTGTSAAATATSTIATTPTGTTAGTPIPTSSTPGGATVNVANDPALGAILVNSAGMTLYYLTSEANGKIQCTGQCIGVWPPLTVPAGTQPTVGPGVSGAVGVITRPDGSQQVTYNGYPLYTFFKDKQPGDKAGLGIKAFGGTWLIPKAIPLSATPVVSLAIHLAGSAHQAVGMVTVRFSTSAGAVQRSCSASCRFVLAAGTRIQLRAHAAQHGWQFVGWRVNIAGQIHALTGAHTRLQVMLPTRINAVYRPASK